MNWSTIDDFGEDLIDSREIIARIDELEGELYDVYEAFADAYVGDLVPNMDDWIDSDPALDTEEQVEMLDELRKLREFADEASGYSEDWRHGATLIRDGYFPRYAEEFADDIGAIDRKAGWPLSHIDWDAAADDLKQDYTEVSINGYDYWIR